MALVVVAYDIGHDGRRGKVHSLLLGYGEPVQESLFECDLEPPALRRLRGQLKRTVRPVDNVRLYYLCADCAERIEDGSGRPPDAAPPVYTV